MKVVRNFEEEERQRKLSDTANKLLRIIKPWSADNDLDKTVGNHKNESGQSKIAEKKSLGSSKFTSENTSTQMQISAFKQKRIAHSNFKNKGVKKQVPKTNVRSPKTQSKSSKYDVNKATVKDFQSRIQHKLINEIMQMPKENLQNVLNDPKINPIMELKMSRLVRENKLLIAEKLRALAESKIASSDSVSNSQLLVDIDKLIDPVIETDLSVLPYELIKQMENIFQVQFDYSNNEGDIQGTSAELLLNMGNEGVTPFQSTSETDCLTVGPTDSSKNTSEESSQVQNVSFVKNETSPCDDFGVYECSTDDDEDLKPSESPGLGVSYIASPEMEKPENSSSENVTVSQATKRTLNKSSDGAKKQKLCESNIRYVRKPFEERKNQKKARKSIARSRNFHQGKNDTPVGSCSSTYTSCDSVMKSPSSSKSQSTSEILSKSCQTYISSKTIGTQTENHATHDIYRGSNQPQPLLGVSLPDYSTDNSPAALLKEVNAIQDFINKLNERRFAIFLHLARTDPEGNFIRNKFTCNNFTETISNGSVSMIESLSNFFVTQQNYSRRHWGPPRKNNNSKKKSRQYRKHEGGNQKSFQVPQ